MDLKEHFSYFIGRGLFYIVMAAAVIGVVNLPIQVTQLILLTHLTFPSVGFPIEIPWYITIGGCVIAMLAGLLVLGIIISKLKIIEHQNTVANENNLQVREILERLERIEKILKPVAVTEDMIIPHYATIDDRLDRGV